MGQSKVISIYKRLGLTPLQLVQEFRKQHPELKDQKIGYMGRLDPLAMGVILLLIGDENRNRERYLHLDKRYQFSALLGVETDSYDTLGIVKSDYTPPPLDFQELIQKFIGKNIGKRSQPYPPYSSKPVQGHALFWWAKQRRLDEIEVPSREIEIYDLRIRNYEGIKVVEEIKAINAIEEIKGKINKVTGDFRQREILESWDKFYSQNSKRTFTIAKFEVYCSSGTYVRQLVHDLGKFLGCGAIAWEIKRTKFGGYDLDDSRI